MIKGGNATPCIPDFEMALGFHPRVLLLKPRFRAGDTWRRRARARASCSGSTGDPPAG